MVMSLSVIVPAFNEELYLPETLRNINKAISFLEGRAKVDVEVIVVDNASTDRTPEIARSLGAKVVHESIHNIGRVRNIGAGIATGDVLIFVDADTLIPANVVSMTFFISKLTYAFTWSPSSRFLWVRPKELWCYSGFNLQR